MLFSTASRNVISVSGDDSTKNNKIKGTCHFILFLQVYDQVLARLKAAYAQTLLRVGDPLDSMTLVGPLHSAAAIRNYQDAVSEAVKAGGTIEFGGKVSYLSAQSAQNDPYPPGPIFHV
jgi:acyl-CoA reductase-like NAD-dependent aldehyde dehydrogenase